MTQYLPPNLLALFAPRDPIPFLPPMQQKPQNAYTGVGLYLADFEDPKDTPPPTRVETKEERIQRKQKERAEATSQKMSEETSKWDPYTSSSGDAFKTLFVGRINYDTSESKLRREFESFGAIRSIRIVTDINTGKPRGYAFVEYEHERDMHSAYKRGDGKKIDGRRVLVDVERARTVKGWKPRRLGGGLGGTRKGGPDMNVRYSGREDVGMGREDDREMDRGDRGDRDRDRNRDRDRERERRRHRSRSREPEGRGPPERERRDRDRDRDRERDRERPKPRERDREKGERDRGERDRERERERGERDRGEKGERDRDRERDKDRERRRNKDKRRDRDRDRKEADREHRHERGGDSEGRGGAPGFKEEGQLLEEGEYDGGDAGKHLLQVAAPTEAMLDGEWDPVVKKEELNGSEPMD